MTDYTQNTYFAPKDALISGDANKRVRGSELDAEFAEIATAIASKQNASTSVSTSAFNGLADSWLDQETSLVGQLHDLADPNADRILFWDDSEGALKMLAIDSSLAIVGQTLSALGAGGGDGTYDPAQVVDHTTISVIAGAGLTGGGTIDGSVTLNIGAGSGISVAADSIGFDFPSLTALSEPIAAGDLTVVYDLSNTGYRKVAYKDAALPVDEVSGTTKTLTNDDMNRVQRCTSASATTITLNTSIGNVGSMIVIVQSGAGQVTVAGTATVNSAAGLKTRVQHSVVVLICVAANTWVLYGDSAV